MKSIKSIMAALLAIVALFIAAPTASSETLNASQRRAVIAEIQKQLPMEVEDGMFWIRAEINADATVMTFTITFDPAEIGLTVAEAKKELNGYTSAQFRKMLGDEFNDMVKSFGCQVNMVLMFPDKTSKIFRFSK